MIKNEKYELYNGDCLEVMDRLIEQGIQVDMILTDPPYIISRETHWKEVLMTRKFGLNKN